MTPGAPQPGEPETVSSGVPLPTWVHGEWSAAAGLVAERALRVDSVSAVSSEASVPTWVNGAWSIAGLPVAAIRVLPDLEPATAVSESRA